MAVSAETTSLAATFGLAGRGLIERGMVADLVAFDPATVTDVGDYRDPVHPPTGIAWVRQAGTLVVTDGRWQVTATAGGCRLRRGHAHPANRSGSTLPVTSPAASPTGRR